MFCKVFILISTYLILTVNARTLVLNEKEIQQISSAFKEALDRHHISTAKEIPFAGTFDCLTPSDCEISIDLDVSYTENGLLSGNDVLNGIANGNGNENGNNGNNNGNVILQFFNAPIDEIFTTKTTTEASTTQNIWWPTNQQ